MRRIYGKSSANSKTKRAFFKGGLTVMKIVRSHPHRGQAGHDDFPKVVAPNTSAKLWRPSTDFTNTGRLAGA